MFIPRGILIIIGLASIATYTGYVIGQFKQRHPGVHSMADAGEVLWGPIGREVLGLAQLILMVFNMGSHVLTFSVMMNTITEHGTCSIVFGIVGMLVSFIGTLPRTLRNVSWMSFVCKDPNRGPKTQTMLENEYCLLTPFSLW